MKMLASTDPPKELTPNGDARPQFTEEQLRASINQAWEDVAFAPMPDSGTQIRELTHKLAESVDDRDRLRAKCAELNRINEQLSQEREALEGSKDRMAQTITSYEQLADGYRREICGLKATLYDYIVAYGELLPQ